MDGSRRSRASWSSGPDRSRRAPPRPPRPRAPSSSGSTSSTVELPLGQRARLVDAQHVHACEPLDRGELLDQDAPSRQSHRRHRERQARQQDQPLRHHRHGPGHRPGDGAPPVRGLAELADEEQGRGRDDRPRDPREDPVDPVEQLRARDGEPPRVLSQLDRVGVAPDPRGAERVRSRLPRTTPNRTSSARSFSTGSASPVRSDSSISRPVESTTSPSTTIWKPGSSTSRSSLTTVRHREVLHRAVANHTRAGGGEQGQPVQRPLGPELLDDADQRVADQHEPEERVLDRAHHQDDREHAAEQGVETREDVRADDLADRAGGGELDGVRLSCCDRAPQPRPTTGPAPERDRCSRLRPCVADYRGGRSGSRGVSSARSPARAPRRRAARRLRPRRSGRAPGGPPSGTRTPRRRADPVRSPGAP